MATARPVRRPRALALAALAATGAVALAACDTTAYESTEHPTVTAAYGQVGDVQVRGATLTLGIDQSSADLTVAFFVDGSSGDRLDSVTANGAAAVLPVPGPGATGRGSTATPTASTSDSATAATSARSVALPAMQALFLDTDSAQIELSGLPQLRLGNTVAVTFTFAAAGSLTLQVPVTAQANPLSAQPSPQVTQANANEPAVTPTPTIVRTNEPSSSPFATPSGSAPSSVEPSSG